MPSKHQYLQPLACFFLFAALLFIAVPLQAQLINQPQKAGWKKFKEKDYAAALKIWRPLAEQGDPDAAFGMAMLYENGFGTARNISASVRWFQIAADKGLTDAQHDLGIKYFTGSGVKKDPAKAYKLWKAAAESGMSAAQAKLAYLYTTGMGTDVNYKEAARWYRQAVKQNNSEAMYNLSLLYQNGTGVRQDKLQFLHWLKQAANFDHARAQYDLGLMLMHGMEVERSVSEGKKWLLKSASNGLVDAQHYLGTLYLNGHILAPDRDKAMALMRAAANQGHRGAKQTLLDLENLAKSDTGSIHIGNSSAITPARKQQTTASTSTSAKKSAPKTSSKAIALARPAAPNPAPVKAAKKQNTSSHKTGWLLAQPSDRYTIQLMATKNEAAAVQYIKRYAEIDAYIYSFVRAKSRWYVAATGIFNTHEKATKQIKNLPTKIRKAKPWARNVGIIKGIINGS